MTNFALLPPEVNSARMYAGPGAGPMLAAAAAWEGLATQMAATAASGAAVVATLAAGWTGPSSALMTAAAQRTITWLHVSTAEAEQTAAQQRAAAAAYETAFAATVPPPAIATNRSLQASLIATNFLGQNTAAIAALEAQYLEMWAQDAAAMLGYAAAAAGASQLAPFSDPPPTTAAPAAASDPSSGLSLLGELTGPLSPLSLLNPALGGYLFGTEMYGLPSVSANVAELAQKVAALPPTTTGQELVHGAARPKVRPATVPATASVGRAGMVGRLSVPPNWISTAPAMSPAAVVAKPVAVTPISSIAGRGGLAGDLALAGAAGGSLAAGGTTTPVVASRGGAPARTAAGSTIFVIQAADWPEERQA
ncbi:PPE family protein [[Mycobacterium] nativiensis]|uniref:PPE family protein n=1 Tax=[Mycobacterium] nativiensis TaxID=2855503 RepID=A0ABU5XX74_9MYCO|nr:PPE family protein [Mycolicibacter sp. MYC340]MEB3032392.1 PPE family protein [Mycolicibacter sp. MYC340]